MSQEYVFAIDFTHESMTAAFVGPDGTEEGTAGFELNDFLAGEANPLDKLLALLAAKAKAAPGVIRAAALSLACDLDAARQTVVSFPQASWLNGVPLPSLLGKTLGVPVEMERRGVILLSYDRIMLGLPDDSLIIGCYVDTLYENALWHRGAPIFGRNGGAGNIAHMTIHDREDVCLCGRLGCVGLYGAGLRLQQIHNMIFPDTPRDELFVRHGDHPIFRDYLAMMAYPIAMEINILDPEYLIIGGAIPSMRGFPRKLLEEEIRRQVYDPGPGREMAFLASPAGAVCGGVCASQYVLAKLGML